MRVRREGCRQGRDGKLAGESIWCGSLGLGTGHGRGVGCVWGVEVWNKWEASENTPGFQVTWSCYPFSSQLESARGLGLEPPLMRKGISLGWFMLQGSREAPGASAPSACLPRAEELHPRPTHS